MSFNILSVSKFLQRIDKSILSSRSHHLIFFFCIFPKANFNDVGIEILKIFTVCGVSNYNMIFVLSSSCKRKSKVSVRRLLCNDIGPNPNLRVIIAQYYRVLVPHSRNTYLHIRMVKRCSIFFTLERGRTS